MPFLPGIASPADVKRLSRDQLPVLARELPGLDVLSHVASLGADQGRAPAVAQRSGCIPASSAPRSSWPIR